MASTYHVPSSVTKGMTFVRQCNKLSGATNDVVRIRNPRGHRGDARRPLEIGLTLSAREEDSRRSQAKMKTQLGRILTLQRDFDAALIPLRDAQKIAESIGDDGLLASCLLRLGCVYDHRQLFTFDGDYDMALAYYQGALVLAEQANDARSQAECLFRAGRLHEIHKHDTLTAVEFYERALAIATEGGCEEAASSPLTHLAHIDERNGDLEGALARHQLSLALKEEAGDAHSVASSLLNVGRILARKGEYGQALDYLHRSIEAAEEVDAHRTALWNLSAIDDFALNQIACEPERRNFEQSGRLLEEIGVADAVIASSLHSIGLVHLRMGRFADAVKAFERSLALMEHGGDVWALGHNYAYLAFAHIGQRQYVLALESVLLHLENIQDVGIDVEHGRSHLAVAFVLDRDRPLSATARSITAEISQMTRLPETPIAYIEAAVETASRASYDETLVPALYEYARCLCRSGDRITGFERLREARERADKAHMKAELNRIDRICRDLGLQLPSQHARQAQLLDGTARRNVHGR